MATTEQPLQKVEDVKTLDAGPSFLYVLKVPEFLVDGQPVAEKEVFAIPVFSRKDGLLLALPLLALPEGVIGSDQPMEEDSLLGPCTVVSSRLVMEEESGTELPLDFETDVILADFHKSVLPRLRGFDPVTEGPDILPFYGDDVDVYPCGEHLQQLASTWVEGIAHERLHYYSAVEEEQPPNPPVPKTTATGKAKSKASSKKVTTATLSEQLSSLAQAIPAISSQLAALQGRQEKMEALMANPAPVPRQLPHRMGFDQPAPAPKVSSPLQFMQGVGSAPRVRQTPVRQPALRFPEDEPIAPPEEREEIPETSDPIAQSLFVQQRALTSLVAHLTQDGLHDLGGASSSTTLSLKGSAKRERLLQELAQRRGGFLLKVAQNAFRRLKPTEAVPQDLPGFQGKAVFTKYLERQGGFGGAQKDLGLVMWLLATMGDLMVAGDQVGAQELLALTMVAVEQTALDGGKWEAEGFCALVSSGVGDNSFGVCEGSRCDQLQAHGSGAFPQAARRRSEGREGGGPKKTKTAQAPKEAKGRRGEVRHDKDGIKAVARSLNTPERTASILGSGEGQRALCKDADKIQDHVCGHDDVPRDFLHVHEASPSWQSLQTVSFAKWASSLCREVLRSRTPFAAFLKSTLSVHRSQAVGSAKALFPLPVPREGVFSASANEGSRRRRKRAFEQAFHVIVMALNYWHADFSFVPLHELSKVPSPAQMKCLVNLRNLVKAYGSSKESVSVPCSGRRATSLTSQLADLCDFLTWQGAACDAYHGGFQGAEGGFSEARIEPDRTRDPSLVPYRSLDPSRLKLAGTGHWDPTPFLSDALWLAYVEPASLVFRDDPGSADVPDLSKEVYDDVLALAKVWDVNGLLWLEDDDTSLDSTCMRFFNCYKSATVDRMIGDRRARNAVEGVIPGASRALPPALLLSALEIKPASERLSICVSDRKDFYHQFRTTAERAKTNMCLPSLFLKDLEQTSALASWVSRKSSKKRERYDRQKHGDFLDRACSVRELPVEAAQKRLRACFASIPQGDALGVEFAVDSHRTLMVQRGVLEAEAEMRADRLFRGGKDACGLVIDDFYTVSVVSSDPAASLPDSWAVRKMKEAQKLYKEERLLGSAEKDIVDADLAKVTGAELDSSSTTRALGLTTLASPWQKRMSLSFLSLKLAQLRWTSDSLHLCLLGGWVHSLLYRRPMMSILAESFHLVDASAICQDSPKIQPLPRKVAEELVLLAVLAPLMTTDLAASFGHEVYATDSSDLKGAVVKAPASPAVVRALWRSSRKRGGYVRMMTREEALVRKLDFLDEPVFEEGQFQRKETVPKPLALRFHFIEVCGGSGKVSRQVASFGWVVGPVLDLDRSPHFDLQNIRLLSWILHLLEEGLLDSFMVEPPCTTFSPAQHPASRSYQEPRGFDPLDEKTHTGTTLALRALTLINKASQVEAPGLLEQPRKSKMRKLDEWQFLVSHQWAEEYITASCMFGSIHLKEFVFLACCLDGMSLSRKCSKDHEHVQIAGKYTKPSATYVDELAVEIAGAFHRALKKKLRLERWQNEKKGGLENPLMNDVLLSSRWEEVSAWRWKVPRHINIQETTVVEVLLRKLAISCPCSRPVVALDSNVGLCSLVKGRSPSRGLQPVLRKIGATAVVGSLYPAHHFSPTRWNPADHPTRDTEIPEPLPSGIDPEASLSELLDFAQGENLRRPFANWVRLFTCLRPAPYGWYSASDSWRFMHHKLKHFPFRFALRHAMSSASMMDFDATLGFPGEGPSFSLFWIFIVFGLFRRWIFPVFRRIALWTFFVFCSALSFLDFGFSSVFAQPATTRPPFLCRRSSTGSGFFRLWILRLAPFVLVFPCDAVASHGYPLQPRDAGDKTRAAARGTLELPEGRPVLGQTQKQRDKLYAGFEEWLKGEGFELREILFVAEPDIETLNIQLERFGRLLYKAGRPYNHYAETINSLSSKRPRIRRSLQPAWDLAYAWLRSEPPNHHLALPWQVLLSLLSTALFWGWPLVAGIIALSRGGLTRIGEALSAFRSQLVLPQDVENSSDFILLQINEPKTRFRVDQPELVRLIEIVFRDVPSTRRLWPYSGQTMRSRFQKLLDANQLSSLPAPFSRGLDLGSLRAGGASWLLMRSEDSELTRRRGRWITSKVMEVYIQECSALQFLPNLPKATKSLIISGVQIFPWVLQQIDDLQRAKIPEMVWSGCNLNNMLVLWVGGCWWLGITWMASHETAARLGWAGRCENLFQLDKLDSPGLCQKACVEDPRCPVWQFRTDSRSCWVGFGIHCDRTVGSLMGRSYPPVDAQRLLHGTVYVVRQLVGVEFEFLDAASEVKVQNLFPMGQPGASQGSDALSIERCKAWCYSNIACQYWQFSQTEGCLVDAPMLSKTLVPYPLTTSALSSGADAHNIIAGAGREYIHHYCPNRTTADVDDAPSVFSHAPANLAVRRDQGAPRGWPWVVVSLLLTLVLAVAGFAYYALIWKGRRGARRTPLQSDGPARAAPQAPEGANFLPVQVARVQTPSAAPTPSSGYPTPTAYRSPGHTPPRNQMFSPYGTGRAGYSPACARSTQFDEAQRLWKDMDDMKILPNIISVTSAIEVCAKSHPRRQDEAERLFRQLVGLSQVRPDTKLIRTMMRAVGMNKCMELCRELGVVDAALQALAASFSKDPVDEQKVAAVACAGHWILRSALGDGCGRLWLVMGCTSSGAVVPLETSEGQFFQRYKLGKKLGEGAFGQVRLTTRIDSGEMYAVKIMDVRNSSDDTRLDSEILREARSEARLLSEVSGHPNVVALHETYLESPGLYYMIMERCYGSLMDSLCDMPKLTEGRLRRMFRQMLLGIGACHNARIVHRALAYRVIVGLGFGWSAVFGHFEGIFNSRALIPGHVTDVKLDNFLYGGLFQETIKLSDLGLAVKLGKRGYVKGVSGTAPYMSPEMLARKRYTTQTDVWSFASTVYVILYGDVPYCPSQPTAASVKKAIVNASPPPQWARNAKLAKHYQQPSSGAETFCRYLLIRDPAERPTISDALNHPFVEEQESSEPEDESEEGSPVIETAGERVRTITDMFKPVRKPIISRNLDEVLERLERAGPPLPAISGSGWERGVSAGRCFTEEMPPLQDDEEQARTALSQRRKASVDQRIVRQSQPPEQPARSYTHSGVTVSQATQSRLLEPEIQGILPEPLEPSASEPSRHDTLQ
eukprot:s1336_g8.t1